ncbi:MAG: hypothetical protein U0599_13865 [Vicinamibacteria bacterium]
MIQRRSFVSGFASLALAVLVSSAPTPALAQGAGPLTLDQVLAAPFASELVVSPDGRAVAWVVVADGVRNVWCAEAPAWTARRVTSYTADDGQEIGELALTGGASPRVVFVRGGGPNRKGEIPNPTSGAEGARQEILVAPLAGGAPRGSRTGTGRSPLPRETASTSSAAGRRASSRSTGRPRTSGCSPRAVASRRCAWRRPASASRS